MGHTADVAAACNYVAGKAHTSPQLDCTVCNIWCFAVQTSEMLSMSMQRKALSQDGGPEWVIGWGPHAHSFFQAVMHPSFEHRAAEGVLPRLCSTPS